MFIPSEEYTKIKKMMEYFDCDIEDLDFLYDDLIPRYGTNYLTFRPSFVAYADLKSFRNWMDENYDIYFDSESENYVTMATIGIVDLFFFKNVESMMAFKIMLPSE